MSDVFDRLTKQIGQATSRREALRTLGAGLLGLVFGAASSKKAVAADPATTLRCRSECQTKCSTRDPKTGRVRMDFVCYRECVPTCESCGKCQVFDVPSQQRGLPCSSPCAAGEMLKTANRFIEFQTLSAYVAGLGYQASGSPEALMLRVGDGFPDRSAVWQDYVVPGVGGLRAQILYREDTSGEKVSVGFFMDKNGKLTSGFFVNASGVIEVTAAPRVAAKAPLNSTIAPSESSQEVGAPKKCDYLCDFLCNNAGNVVSCAALGFVLCPFPHPAAKVVCGLAAGIACNGLTQTACSLICGNEVCKCPGSTLPCSPTQCYSPRGCETCIDGVVLPRKCKSPCLFCSPFPGNGGCVPRAPAGEPIGQDCGDECCRQNTECLTTPTGKHCVPKCDAGLTRCGTGPCCFVGSLPGDVTGFCSGNQCCIQRNGDPNGPICVG